MANSSFDAQKIAEALRKASGGKFDSRSIDAAQHGDPSALLGALNQAERQKIERLLKDKTALNRLLSDEKTKELFRNISGKDHG